ncbi:MAG: hypothetical protein HY088_10465 [Ignavibacteriales bacterium]|nr:hypothetical protein [Ignavibacteriales bacterium]
MATRVLLVAITFIVVGCSSSKEAGSGAITGIIQVIGNEPFTTVAIQRADGTMYRISASREIEQRLRAMQGKTMELRYSELSSSPEGLRIVVKELKEQKSGQSK